VVIKPRDLAILDFIGELGTADTKILHERFYPGKTLRSCQQRLKKIADEGLLKPVPQIAVDSPSGSSPMLYFLTGEGADLVERETGRRPRRITRSDPKPFTLRHRMDTVRARLAIDQAAELAGIAAPEWIMEQDSRGGGKARKGRSPSESQILNNRYEHNGQTVAFRPDASCHLQVPHKGLLASLATYLEVDRSTEGHLQWRERKLPGMVEFLNDAKAWKGHWPNVVEPQIRIFVLCKSQQRITELTETIKPTSAAHSIRLTLYPLDPATVLTGDVWQDCQGERKRIIRAQ
jgi:hypothetical protein